MGNYELLFECFLTGQMNEAEFFRHVEADDVFKAWVARRMRARQIERSIREALS